MNPAHWADSWRDRRHCGTQCHARDFLYVKDAVDLYILIAIAVLIVILISLAIFLRIKRASSKNYSENYQLTQTPNYENYN